MSERTELNRIMSCLLIAVEESGIVMGVGDCTRLASHFQDALHADQMALMWQSAVDQAVAEMEDPQADDGFQKWTHA